MKHKIKGTQNNKMVDITVPKKPNEYSCDSNLDQAIAEIQSRANHVGELLNGIIQPPSSSGPNIHHHR
jgi:hypothetical protein